MTPTQIAQSLADAQGRPWWLWTDRQGRNRLACRLADTTGHVQLQRFNPAGRFRQLQVQQSIAPTR